MNVPGAPQNITGADQNVLEFTREKPTQMSCIPIASASVWDQNQRGACDLSSDKLRSLHQNQTNSKELTVSNECIARNSR